MHVWEQKGKIFGRLHVKKITIEIVQMIQNKTYKIVKIDESINRDGFLARFY